MRADMHLNYAWGLSCKHPAQKAGLRSHKSRPAAACRITAMTDLGEIYRTELGPVTLTDLKLEFLRVLSNADVNDGAIPSDIEVSVGSRLKIHDAHSHIGLGYAYAHPNINGRPRYAALKARMLVRLLFFT